jgi:two-component system nitrogen regulation response regulator NtrX
MIIDDEKNIRISLTNILEDEGYTVDSYSTINSGLQALLESDPDLILLDVKLPDGNGIDALAKIKETLAQIPVIMISGNSNISDAVKAIKLGAYDFLEKPLSLPKIKITVKKALDFYAMTLKLMRIQADSERGWRMVGESKVMQELNALINRVAPSNAKILVYGESGTGKEVIARLIHARSARSAKAFVKFNSAAIPKELIESELFGFEKGAFTGATARKKGKLEEADQGTLFLDEITELPFDTQVKLLQVLQERQFLKVGGIRPVTVDFRLVTATNRDIAECVKAGKFREDLFYRLYVVPIEVPPLRERRDEILPLLQYYINYYNKKYDTCKSFSLQAVSLLRHHDWPGNIRELKNIVERLAVTSLEEVISYKSVLSAFGHNEKISYVSSDKKLSDLMEEFEQDIITQCYKELGSSYKVAARLGISQRTALRKINKYMAGSQ